VNDVWIGIDVGTTAIKVAAYGPDGSRQAASERPTEIRHTPDGGAEQDMQAVWRTVCRCLVDISDLLKGHTIGSIGICAQGDGFWPIDATGVPVGRATLWLDTRSTAADDLAGLVQDGKAAVIGQGCHTALWPGTSALAWRDLRRRDPGAARQVAHGLTCGDWIGFKLTGEIATDYSNATIPFLDLVSREYGARQVQALDCEDLLATLPRPRWATETLGILSADAARETGLPESLPVAVATLDLGAMLVGMGLAEVGDSLIILGTTAVASLLTNQVQPTETPIGASVLHPSREVIVRVLAPSTGSVALDWFASLHASEGSGDDAREHFEQVNTLASNAQVGAGGVTFLPYLNGERAPFVSPGVRAMFRGLSPTSTKGELARAVMEGCALSIRHCFATEGGLPKMAIGMAGGGTRNPLWCQIIADVIGQDILVNPAADLGLWGAACLGAAAAGKGDPIQLARREENIEHYTVNRETHAAYDDVYARYVIVSQAEQDIVSRLESRS